MDFVATCKNKTGEKQCTFHFCRKCLLNRYGEEAEDMALLNDWMCPRCRGICNCSFCMKKRGSQPTGILIHVAKANGFCSVSEMLHRKDYQNLGSAKMETSAPGSRKYGKQNSFGGLRDLDLLAELLEVYSKGVGTETKLRKSSNKGGYGNASHIIEPIDVTAEDVRHAMQFLEFCEALRKEPAVLTTNYGMQKSFQPRDSGLQAEYSTVSGQGLETGVSKLKQSKKKNGCRTASGVKMYNDSTAQRESSTTEGEICESNGRHLIGMNSNAKVPKEAYPKTIKMKNKAVNTVHCESFVAKQELLARSQQSDKNHATEP